MYQLINDNTVLLIEDNRFIPFDTGNKDYQEYLRWVAEGNTPLPPDDVPINIPEPSVIDQAVLLLLKLSTPISAEDIAMKDELTSKLQPK